MKSHSQDSRMISREVLIVASLLPKYSAAPESVLVFGSALYMTFKDLQQYALDLEFGKVSGETS